MTYVDQQRDSAGIVTAPRLDCLQSVHGLRCPSVFTGGMNFHGVYECIPVKSLEKAAEVAVMLARMSAEVKSLR